MRTRFLHSALLLAALPKLARLASFAALTSVACQPSSYVLVQLDSVPEAARSLKILVQRGSQVSTPLVPLALPNSDTAGLSFRLDLPSAADESQPLDVQVGAFSRAAGEGCLLAAGGTQAQPRAVASVHVAPIADLATCTDGDVVVQSVTPNLLPTDTLSSTELVLKGWGFQPTTQIAIDGAPAARTTFVSATELRVVAPAAKRVGMQPISGQNQGSAHTTSGLLAYYSNQVAYTSMPPTSWNELGISHPVLAINGSALLRTDALPPRFSLLTTEYSPLTPWDLITGYPFFGYAPRMVGAGPIITKSGIFRYSLRSPAQILIGQFDIEPLDDVAIIDTARMDGDVQYKVAIYESIADDTTFVYCSNIQDKSTVIAAITKRPVKDKAVSDLVLGYNDGSFGLMLGTPRGLFIGTGSKQPNLCEVHLTTTPGLITSVQSLHYLRIPPMSLENYVLVANQGKSLYLLPSYDTSMGPAPNGESTYLHTPYLMADMTNSPISQAAIEDLDKDGLNEIILLYHKGNQPYVRIYHGLPPAMINFRNIAQFNTPTADFPIAHDCIQASPLRLTDINWDGYADITFGCRNNSGPSSIEAVLSSGSPLKFVEQAQTVFIQPPNIDGDRVFFERIDPGSAQPLELWGGIGATPFRLINTSH